MRNTFAKELCAMADKDSSIHLLTGDLGFSVLEPFAKAFPKRYFNMGVAEQNMVGVAAGLAKEGAKVFVYSIGNFPTLRAMEQIRYDVCYHELDVKVVAVGSGYAYGALGASHHATEEAGMLRSIPNMVVTSPADAHEVLHVMNYFSKHKGPGYLRINKGGESLVHPGPVNVKYFEPVLVREGIEKIVLSTGAISSYAKMECEKKNYELWTFPFISGLDLTPVLQKISRFKEVVVIEEHQLNCGFGSAILETLNDLYYSGKISTFPKVKRIGIQNQFISVAGSQDYLRSVAGLILE